MKDVSCIVDFNKIRFVMKNCSKLAQDIEYQRSRLIQIVIGISAENRTLKIIEGTGGKISVADLMAYQIGWGKNLMRWYEAGVAGIQPQMTGDGFSKWDYVAIANHFYGKYAYDSSTEQMRVFQEVTTRLLEIVNREYEMGRLDRIGIWNWCKLSSGKEWPLCKWIQVNTVSPYKRAVQLIKKASLYL